MHFCTGGYGEDSSRLRNFEGFKLVTNLKETKEAKCKFYDYSFHYNHFFCQCNQLQLLSNFMITDYITITFLSV